MSDVSAADLRREVKAILKDADLSTISAKRVREQVESKLNCSLISRKKEFDRIVMDVINEQQNDDDDEEDGSDPEEDPEDEPSEDDDEPSSDENAKNKKVQKKSTQKKRPQPTHHKTASKKKRKSLNASDSGTESDAGSDSDYEVPKKTAAKKKKSPGGGSAGAAGAAPARKSTGFTRAYTLSPELSALMGAESLPRHEVVKKVWAIIKERDLYDPKNKQFAICDDELMKVMKVKRFRTFGMLKHLKQHFLD